MTAFVDLHPGWRLLDPAQLERAYSPSSCIGGDYRPFVQAYRQRSLQARDEAASLGGQWSEHRHGPLPAQRFDLCRPPQAAAPAGLLVFIHGGYWQELAAADSLFAAAACIGQGLAFAALDYTLAPAASLPQIVAECRQALACIVETSATLGVDPTRIVLAGSSAGAHLAAMVALDAALHLHTRLAGMVLVSGIYDLEPLVHTSINDALGMDLATALAQSPARLPLQGLPPTVACWGAIETDAFKLQSQNFAMALRAAGVACLDFEVPARNHFDVILDLADARSPLMRQTLALFA